MLTEKDREDILSLMGAFIQSMNEWEKFCNLIAQDKTLTFEEQFLKQKSLVIEIFQEYCTDKDRKFGRPTTVSYGNEGSYEYDPETEKILKIEDNDSKNKTIIITESAGVLPSKYQYIVVKKKGKWLLDSKKRYSSWKKQWMIEPL